MVSQIPGFELDTGDGGQRGLGQASGNVLLNGQRLSAKGDAARQALARIAAADVIGIDLVDGTALNIQGLAGEVANIRARHRDRLGRRDRTRHRSIGSTGSPTPATIGRRRACSSSIRRSPG